MDQVYEYVGNVHVHSVYSDGAYSPAQIAHVGKTLGIDFIILNDHSHMASKLHLEDEGFYGNVLLLVGLEIGGRYHHYLAYDIKSLISGQDDNPQEVIDMVNGQGGFGFLAHPFEKGMPFHEHSVAYTWNDLSVEGYSGICIWNFSSRWKERIKTPFHGLIFLLFKSQLLKGPSKKTLNFWDKVSLKRKVVGIGGSDAHGTRFKIGLIEFTPLPYEFTLSSINIHILTTVPLSGKFSDAKSQVYEAMKYGRLYIANDSLSNATGFSFYFFGDDGKVYHMGTEMNFVPGLLKISVPDRGQIRVIRNGVLEQKWVNRKRVVWHIARPGVYRVEVFKYLPLFGWRPWIFSNPVFLR